MKCKYCRGQMHKEKSKYIHEENGLSICPINYEVQ